MPITTRWLLVLLVAALARKAACLPFQDVPAPGSHPSLAFQAALSPLDSLLGGRPPVAAAAARRPLNATETESGLQARGTVVRPDGHRHARQADRRCQIVNQRHTAAIAVSNTSVTAFSLSSLPQTGYFDYAQLVSAGSPFTFRIVFDGNLYLVPGRRHRSVTTLYSDTALTGFSATDSTIWCQVAGNTWGTSKYHPVSSNSCGSDDSSYLAVREDTAPGTYKTGFSSSYRDNVNFLVNCAD